MPWWMEGDGNWGNIPNAGDNQQVRDASEKPCADQAGNPVMLTTGNKIESTMDFSSAGEMGLYLRRTYNHYWTYPGLLGQHWVTSFDYSLVRQGTNTLWAQRPDGRRIKFVWNTTRQRFEEEKAAPVAFIVRHASGSYTHHTENRLVEEYDSFGYVQSVKNQAGLGWQFLYDGNNFLRTVTHTSGRSVQFTWVGTLLTRITDPDGAHYDFGYHANIFGQGMHRLASVTLPGTPVTAVTYHYENTLFPGALTGISWGSVRYATFGYDGQGRAAFSRHAGPTGPVDANTFTYSGINIPPGNSPPLPPPPGGDCDPVTYLCTPPKIGVDAGEDTAELAHRQQIAEAALAILSQPLSLN